MKNFLKYVFCVLCLFLIIVQCGCLMRSFRYEYNTGMSLYNQKKYSQAIESFNKALVYRPNSYSTLCFLGASYAYNKEYKLAEKTFQDAIKVYPDEWNAYVLLADLKKRQKNYDAAIDLLETAVSLVSMGGEEKLYYKNLIKNIKEENTVYLLNDPYVKQQAREKFKNEVINAYTKEDSKSSNKIQNGDVILSLDSKKWVKIQEKKDEKSRVVNYVISGENFPSAKDSKLVTVQYDILSEIFKPTLSEYYTNHIDSISNVAKNSKLPFEKKIISQTSSEILYEWNFNNGTENEIARIVYSPNGVYHLHVVKKGVFTNEEKSMFVEILKNALLR